MFLPWWHPALAKLKSMTANRRRPGRVKPRPYRPHLESLEQRLAPATIAVTSTNDDSAVDGTVSLREAIASINAGANINADVVAVGTYGTNDTIDFAIPGTGVQTITPLSALPTITNPVVIDGYSQAGASPNTNGPGLGDNAVLLIEINGTSAGASTDGLTIAAGNCTVQGLVINRFARAGINLQTNGGNTIVGNFIGTDPTGTTARSNSSPGVDIRSGNGNTIGGTTPADRNVISSNAPGLGNVVVSTNNNLVEGNFIGTDATGTVLLANNQGDGVLMNQGAADNNVGGTVAGAGNVISVGSFDGLDVRGPGNLIQGNLIGTDVTGTLALGNRQGIATNQIGGAPSPNTTIGGTAAGAGNLISGSGGFAILIGNASDGTVIQGNLIGTQKDGISSLGNGQSGIVISGTGVSVGGTVAGAGNVIAFSRLQGVDVAGGTGNPILGNSIYANGGNGIQLDSGGNNNQQAPVISSVLPAGGGTVIQGTLSSTANATFRIEFFDNNAPDPNGFGEGQHFLGFVNVTTDTSGNASFSFTSSTRAAIVTATATNTSTNDTSQFSQVAVNPLVVTTTADETNANDGLTSLREAINFANSNPGTDTITFRIPGSGVQTIGPTSALPTITDPVIIDGTSQPGFAGTPIIELDGANLTSADSGLVLAAGSSTIRGLAIDRYSGNDIVVQGSNETIAGNFIGISPSGTVAQHSGAGILLGGANNLIGGTTAADRNVISNNGNGIEINGSGQNAVEGNFIGTDGTGTTALANAHGIVIDSGADGNTIGGTASGAGNIISGNTGDGIDVSSSGNLVQGNDIGTDVTGTVALPNNNIGIAVQAGPNNTIGGTAAGARNVISGNGSYGVNLMSSGNLVEGNYIGIDINGTNALGNGLSGVAIAANNNTLGGTTTGAGNVIAANSASQDNVFINQSVSGTIIEGNFIGTNVAGTAALGGGGGIGDAGTTSTIGGTASGAGNLISGNNGRGIILFTTENGDLVQGNLIGTDVTGTVALGNGGSGIEIDGNNNSIGGTTAAARNVIAGNGANTSAGVYIGGSNNLVQGNYIGTNALGTAALGNVNSGVQIVTGASNTIGGTTAGAGNVISGTTPGGSSSGDGVLVTANAGPGNLIQGNFIGTDATGKVPLGNFGNGVDVNSFAAAVTIGGTVSGAGNLISGNHQTGILAAVAGTVVEGNFIGTDVTGTVALGNAASGIQVFASSVTIGGTVAAARNVISGNSANGIELSSTGDLVQGNFIGTDITGAAALGNAGDGVLVSGGSGNTIGGAASGAGNVISGNGGAGIDLQSQSAGPLFTTIQNDLIGTDVTGTNALGNAGDGVLIDASNNSIGGTTAGTTNTIAFNGRSGVFVESGTGNAIRENSIFSNSNLGIHLNSSLGANNNQQFPVLTSASSSASGTTISGTLTSTPSTTFDLDFFSNTTADPSGFGQGQTFLGTATATTDASGNANFTVTVSTPVPSGQPFLSATATDPNGNTSEFAKDIQVRSGTLTASGTTVAATEGTAFTAVVATFTDSDTGVSSSNFTATIDWGDGSTSTGTITGSAGSFTVNGRHTFAEEGSFTVTTKIHDIMDNLDATATSSATVADAALTSAATSTSAVEGSKTSITKILVATFTDADPNGTASDYSATINWGDGDTTATVSITADPNVAGQFDVTATKTNAYAEEGTKAVTVSINDAGGSTTSANSTITVTDAVLTPTATSNNAVEGNKSGVTKVLVATFTDADPNGTASDYSATVNWGDGDTTASVSISPDSTVAGQFDVTATKSNAYAEEGTKTVVVTISDVGGSSTTATSTIAVADAALTATPVAVCSAESIPVTNIPVATFTDAGGVEAVGSYTATIDWGDSTPATAGSITLTGGTFTVHGTHTYTLEGTYAVHVSIQDEGGSSTSLSTVATIGGFVTGLYQKVLIRVPDAPGLAFWVSLIHAGVPRQQVAEAFWVSPEHRGLEVDQFYRTFFHRVADAGGRAFWVNALLAGATENDVSVAFMVSDEYTQSHPDTDSYVTGLYNDVLRRAPDSNGFSFWKQILDNGVRSRAAVAFYFLTSTEAFLQAIDDYYLNFLGRTPAASEEQPFLAALESGATPAAITTIFLGSPEFLAREIATACQPM